MENEIVLGLDRNLLSDILTIQKGFIKDTNHYSFIKQSLRGMDRPLAETDPSFKQIIPYLYIQHGDEFLLYVRTKKQTETRLHEKMSLGIGGHINPIDEVSKEDIINEALKRELTEEIDIPIINAPSFMGFINDDLSEVGSVHLGLVFCAQAVSKSFNVIEKDKMRCEWVSKEFISTNYDKLESWSQILFDFLNTAKYNYNKV